MLEGRAISPAGNRWQKGLLSGLLSVGHQIRILGFRPEPAWPAGPLFPQSHTTTFGSASVSIKPYVNLPYIRNLSQWFTLERFFRRRLPALPQVVLSYNAPPPVRRAALSAQEARIPWVPIIADVPTSEIDRMDHDRCVRSARGAVYLSQHLFDQAHNPKLHLDGGVEKLPPPKHAAVHRAFLYTGLISNYTGVFDLVTEFRKLPEDNIELWICGKGDHERVKTCVGNDHRVKLFGTVSEEKLSELSEKTLAFVNPRRPDDPYNATNFPSKVLEYLSYGKPVVSTWTPGLSSDYRSVLTCCDSITDLNSKMAEVLTWSTDRLNEHRARIAEFLSERTWQKQAVRLTEFLNHRILS